MSYIKTLPPTSVETERVFSSAGLFIPKIRSQLNDICNLFFVVLTKTFLKLGKTVFFYLLLYPDDLKPLCSLPLLC